MHFDFSLFSPFVGTDALSAINLTAPVIQLVTAVSAMLATGGSAVIMKKMGEQKCGEAREDFTCTPMKSKNKRLTIGQFAALHGIHKKTLMWYDEIGLFQPATEIMEP